MSPGRMKSDERPDIDPRVIDGAIVVVGAALTILAVRGSWSSFDGWVIALAGLLSSFALWWIRRLPVSITALAAVAHLFSGNPWPLAVGLFATGATLRYGRTLALGLAGAVSFIGIELLEAGTLGFNEVSSATLLVVVISAIGIYAGTRRELMASLRSRAESAESERNLRLEQARRGERTLIAREMHDVLAHKVTLIALHAGALEVNPSVGPDKVEEAAVLIAATARSALDELRTVLGLLRSETEPAISMQEEFADLDELVASSKRAGIDITYQNAVGLIPSSIGRAVYRLVQEGLTNAVRHAPGARVEVSLTMAGGELLVSVRNDRSIGAGNPVMTGSGTGLVGLRERLRLVGASLAILDEETGGWTLEGRFPSAAFEPGLTVRGQAVT